MAARTLLHYELLEKVGEGGMGAVYKARDTHLNRYVAIKLLPPDRPVDRDRKLRFVQEAQAASALNHPNIITIHDVASADGTDFIVMEYLAGKTLDEMIPRKGNAVGRRVEICDPNCRCAHRGARRRYHSSGPSRPTSW